MNRHYQVEPCRFCVIRQSYYGAMNPGEGVKVELYPSRKGIAMNLSRGHRGILKIYPSTLTVKDLSYLVND